MSTIKDSSKPIEMSEVSKVVGEAAKVQAEQTQFVRSLRFNIEGELTHIDTKIDDGTIQRDINYQADENFDVLDVKLYSIKELENLLGSTDIYQRIFSLRLLTNGLISNPKLTQ